MKLNVFYSLYGGAEGVFIVMKIADRSHVICTSWENRASVRCGDRIRCRTCNTAHQTGLNSNGMIRNDKVVASRSRTGACLRDADRERLHFAQEGKGDFKYFILYHEYQESSSCIPRTELTFSYVLSTRRFCVCEICVCTASAYRPLLFFSAPRSQSVSH